MGSDEHYNRYNPKYTLADAEQYIRANNAWAKTKDLAEEFDVSNAAIRDRLKKADRITHFKDRDTLYWIVDPNADSKSFLGVPEKAFYHLFNLARWISLVAMLLFVLVALIGFTFGNVYMSIVMYTLGLVCGFLWVLSMLGMRMYKHTAAPDFRFSDLHRYIGNSSDE